MNAHMKKNNFDLLRLIAAFQVCISHSAEALSVSGGGLYKLVILILGVVPGVPIFFFISGFLISASYERSPSLRSYARNRFLRIFPALWFALFCSVLLILYFGFFPIRHPGEFLTWLLAQASFVQFYNPVFLRTFGTGVMNGSLWTIPVELQFYLAIPLLYLFLKGKNSNQILFGFLILFTAINFIYIHFLPPAIAYHTSHQSLWSYVFLREIFRCTLVPYFYMFLFGICIQRNLQVILPLIEGKAIYWLLAYFVIALSLNSPAMKFESNLQNFLAFAFLAITCTSVAYSFKGTATFLLRGNDISYGVYLYHMLVVNGLIMLGFTGRLRDLLLCLTVTTFAAYLSWKLIEQPALRKKSRKEAPSVQMHIAEVPINPPPSLGNA